MIQLGRTVYALTCLGLLLAAVTGIALMYALVDGWLWKRDLATDDLDTRLEETPHDRRL